MKTAFVRSFVPALIMLCAAAAFAQDAAKPTPPAPTQPVPGSAAEAPKLVYVLMTVSGAAKGDVVIELNHEKAPISVDNFLSYVDKKYYDSTIFHRVMSTFMVQGGGFTADMQQKPTDAPIKNEWQNGLKNARGTLAMARTNNPDSATSQFFINVVDNTSLDQPISGGAGYAVFGKVVAGMNVVDAIKVVRVGQKGMHGNCPIDTVLIEKIARLTDEEAKKLIEAVAKPATETPAAPAKP